MEVHIGGHAIGPGHPPFVIAEVGINHDGDLARAHAFLDAAADAGAHAVKFQTFRAKDLVTADAARAAYQARNTGDSGSQLAMLSALELPDQAFPDLASHARERGVVFLSSPHTESAVAVLEPIVPAFKLGSGDVVNPLLLRSVARTGKPVLLGTGMATLPEVVRAIAWLEEHGPREIILLHCTTTYPCPAEDVNLRAMTAVADHTGRLVGYSDHSLGDQVPIMAAARGAVVIEKHFTLDRSRSGPDHAASMEPADFRRMVDALERVPIILGAADKQPTESELEIRPSVRKSVALARDLEAGTILRELDLMAKRPGTGIPIEDLDSVVGRRLVRELHAGTVLSRDDLLPREDLRLE